MKKKTSQKDSNLFSGILIFSVVIISIFLLVSSWKISQKRRTLLAKVDFLKEEIEELENMNQGLKDGMADLSDEQYWEQRLRDSGYAKPGETMVVVKKEETEQPEVIETSIWSKLLGEMIGIFK